MAAFNGTLFRYPGPGGWHFVKVPKKYAPLPTHGWGRTPVRATLDGITWDTSVWWDTKSKSTLLAVPQKLRGAREAGARVRITLEPR